MERWPLPLRLEQEQQFFLSARLGKAVHINELRRRPNLGIGALQNFSGTKLGLCRS